jgi:guanylate cyclase, other
MEYMDHGSLYHLLRNKTMVLNGEVLLPILCDIVQGVRFLHAASPKVIHGDLKAQNVLVDSRFRAKVADFGMSLKREATGTLYWMAPELLRGESINTTSSDVYAFGIILCEVYSRQNPYEGEDDVNRIFLDITDQSINRRPTVPSSCPPSVRSIMTDCLQADPLKRPTFEELDNRLKRMDTAEVEPREVMDLAEQQAVPKEEQVYGMRHTNHRQVFPDHVQKALDEGYIVPPQLRHVVTIFMSGVTDLTSISATLSPAQVSDMFERLYHTMDLLAGQHDVFKIETIGDSYMAIANLAKDQEDHTKRIAEFAIDVLKAAQETLIDVDNPDLGYVTLRIGIHTGPLVANVIGLDNREYLQFCLVHFQNLSSSSHALDPSASWSHNQ